MVGAHLAWSASASHEPQEVHFLFVEATTIDLEQRPGLEGLEVNYDLGAPDPAGGSYCGDPDVDIDLANRSFSFDDSRTDTQCAEVLLRMPVPPGAARLLVAFQANRSIGADTSLSVPFHIVQQFRIFSERGDLEFARDYFDDTEGERPDFENFTFQEAVPTGAAGLTLSWLFNDQGAESSLDQRLGGLHNFEATVRNITLSWPGISLPPPAAEPGQEAVDEEARLGVADYALHVDVPAFATSPDTSATMALTVRHGPELVAVEGPGGPIPAAGFTTTDDGMRLTVQLLGPTLDAQGPGDYKLTYRTTRVLAPLPQPAEPALIYPFYYILAFLPMVAAVLALHQANVYVRLAEGSYKRTAWPVFIAIVLVVVYYALLLAYSFFGIGPTGMSTLPLAREPLLIYVQFVLLLLMLAGSALAVSRTLIGTMRRDIEERRVKEDQLRRSNQELERFAYVASHDLQEPLRKVAGFTALLQKRYAGRLDKDADEIIQYAVDGATRMQMLIKDILAYSRVGSKELNRVPVDTNATMQLVASDLGEQVKDHNAHLAWDDLPTVRVDASQMRQILQNLVENAIKYRHPKRRPKVRVSAIDEGPAWHFTVSDNGQGIPEDKHEEIFGIFRRLHGQDQPGTGIGLAVAKKAVERHGGRIWVESTPGKGSTFHFTLPHSPLDASPSRPAPSSEGSSATGAV